MFAALAISRHLNKTTGVSIRRIIRALRPLHDVTINIDGHELTAPTPPTSEAADILATLYPRALRTNLTRSRSDLAGHASYGYCASHSRYFWGFRLYLVCTPDGMPVIWGLANPKIGEREAAQAMLDHDRHLLHPGQVFVGDKGFAGAEFEAFITDDLGVHLIRPDRKDEKIDYHRKRVDWAVAMMRSATSSA